MSSQHFVGDRVGYSLHVQDTMEVGHEMPRGDLGAFSDKTILAIGSGRECWEDAYFSAHAANATVINIDPRYAIAQYGIHVRKFSRVHSGVELAGLAQALPLRDESVDAVFSSWSIPLVFVEDCQEQEARQQITNVAHELWRVLKPEGVISLMPVSDVRLNRMRQLRQQDVVRWTFGSAGFDCETTPVPLWWNNRRFTTARLNGTKQMVEYSGLEPLTSSLPARRSSQLS